MIGLWQCKECRHEFEGSGAECPSCGGVIYLLAEVTPWGSIKKWYFKENRGRSVDTDPAPRE